MSLQSKRSSGPKSEPGLLAKRRRLLGQTLGRIVDSRSWNLVSVLFTIYALFGDDFRLVATEKPADSAFNVLVLMCLTFFAFEIILKCAAQSDYFLGFFFSLDCVATASLVLDLSWVADLLQADDVGDQGEQARSGRTARVGASLGRVVRVLRLVRVLKLYKAYYERRNIRAKKKKKQPGAGGGPGSGDKAPQVADKWDSDAWDDGGQTEDATATGSESLVGKRLVALTTRKVILLVLLMLLALPFLMVPTSELFSSSAAWGADTIWASFHKYQAGNVSREVYEENVLRYLYYHNWFDGHGDCSNRAQDCANAFHAHTFWIGVAGSNMETLRTQANASQIRASSITDWEQKLAGMGSTLYSVGRFPAEAREALAAPWDMVCEFGGVQHMGLSLLSREISGVLRHTVRCPTDLRTGEIRRYSPLLLRKSQFNDWHLAVFFDIRPFVKAGATFGILTTVFICVVLTVASVLFSSDANSLVLAPIERMIAKVNTIRDNPLQAIKMADAQFEVEERKKHRERRKMESIRQSFRATGADQTSRQKIMEACRRFYAWGMSLTKSKEEEALAETAVLEKTIIKLGTLLALGFGHAGVNIVSSNMGALDSAGVNAMIPGVCVDCIIGYAKIHNFSTATEVLQTKIMTFVNQIAEIVHGLATEYHGAPNKNNGDTFLIIWRVEDHDKHNLTRLSDMSLLSFAKILGQVHKSPVLARYRTHPGLQQRLKDRCRVDLGFGLHRGWAIEGAVGSDFKIDASYLSPNVSIAESLETATHTYKVHLLASEPVIASCTPAVAGCCRVIDNAMVRGSKAPLTLRVFDLDVFQLEVETSPIVPWNVRQRFRARQLLEVKKKQKWNMSSDLLGEAEEVAIMRRSYTEAFFQNFNMGYQNYAEGEWKTAKEFLIRTSTMLGFDDGPSRALLAFMERHGFEAPPDWRGVRNFAGPGAVIGMA